MKEPFSAWREGATHYGPGLGVSVLALLPGLQHHWLILPSLLLLVVSVAVALFFRDPRRTIQARPEELVSPADGTIVAIEDLKQTPYYDGPCRRLAIFLSVLSVHVNRAPFDGTVSKIEYKRGTYKNALNPVSSDVNESNALWFETAHGPITVRQISGAIARRIVCKAVVGDRLTKGEKFGMIKFGSRTELYLPPGAEVCVAVKEPVRGGTSIVARFADGHHE